MKYSGNLVKTIFLAVFAFAMFAGIGMSAHELSAVSIDVTNMTTLNQNTTVNITITSDSTSTDGITTVNFTTFSGGSYAADTYIPYVDVNPTGNSTGATCSAGTAFGANTSTTSVTCDLSGDPLAAGETESFYLNITPTADGTFFVNISTTDNAGTPETDYNATADIIVDSTVPTITVITPNDGLNTTGSEVINITVSDAHINNNSVYYQIANSSGSNVTAWIQMTNYTAVGSTANFTATQDFSSGFADGSYYIMFRVNDTYNNINTSYVGLDNISITVDNSVPTWDLSGTTPIDGANISGSFQIDGFKLTDLTLDNNSVSFQILNSSGDNVTGWVQLHNTTGLSGNSMNFSSGSVDVSGLSDGTHYIVFNATDMAGNTNDSTYTNISITIDNTAPTWDLSGMTPIDGANISGSFQIDGFKLTDLTLDNNSVSFQILNSSGDNVTGWVQLHNTTGLSGNSMNFSSGSVDVSGLSDGTHYIVFNATDMAGNTNDSTYTNISITIDNTAPIIDISSATPVQGANVSGNIVIAHVTVRDLTLSNNTMYFMVMNSTGNMTSWRPMTNSTFTAGSGDTGLAQANFTATFDTTTIPDNTNYYIIFNTTDAAGNQNAANHSINITLGYVDNTYPRVTLNFVGALAASNNVSGESVPLTATLVDAGSGIKNAYYRLTIVGGSNVTGWRPLTNASGNTHSGNWTATINTTEFDDEYYYVELNFTDNVNNENSTENFTAVIDNDAPTNLDIQFNISNNTLWSSGLTVNITANFTEPTALTNSTLIITQISSGTTWTCDNVAAYQDELLNCSLTDVGNTNYGGEYRAELIVVSPLHTTQVTKTESFYLYNADPYAPSSTGVNIQSATFSQKRSKYALMVPEIRPSSETNTSVSLLDSGMTMPVYFADSNGNFVLPMASPDTIENLAYTYTFSVNHSGVANGTLVNITLYAPRLVPAKQVPTTVYTPAGEQTVNMISPDFTDRSDPSSGISSFTVTYNGQTWNTTTNSTATYGSYNFSNGEIKFTVNATDNSTLLNGTLLLAVSPPINITSQSVSGINITQGPTLSDDANSTAVAYLMNMTDISNYYTPNNLTMMFAFPANVTVWDGAMGASANTTTNITTNPELRYWNGSAYEILANSTYQAGNITNVTSCFNISFNVSGSAIGAKNMTVCLSGYEWKISQTSLLDFTYGTTKAVNFTANISFPILSNSTSSSAVSTSSTSGSTTTTTTTTTHGYKSTVMMGSSGALRIPNSKLGSSWTSKTGTPIIKVNGRPLTTAQWAEGSVIINGTGLDEGPVDIQVSYETQSTSSVVHTEGPASATTTTKVSAGTQTPVVEQVTGSLHPADAGDTTTLTMPSSLSKALSIDKIEIEASADIPENAKLDVAKLAEAPKTINVAPPAASQGNAPVYAYIEITPNGFSTNNVKQAKVDFKVEKSWLADNGFKQEEMALNRYHGEKWNELPTEVLSDDDTYVYYRAITPGFSSFAILPKIEAVNVTTEQAEEAQKTPSKPPAPTEVIEQPKEETTTPTQTTTPPEQIPATTQPEITPAGVDYTTTIIVIAAVVVAIGIALFLWTRMKA